MPTFDRRSMPAGTIPATATAPQIMIAVIARPHIDPHAPPRGWSATV